MSEDKVTNYRNSHNFIDLTGQRFGLLTVLHRDFSRGVKPTRWVCQCDCGVVKHGIQGTNLYTGGSRSCGCQTRKKASDRLKTHGKSHTPLHRVWCSMHGRCRRVTDPNYHNYGGRGITVCERWNSFEAFLEDMEPRPKGASIDRIDNSKGYSPENCEWSNQKRQTRNTRLTLQLMHNGITKPLADWCDELGVNRTAAIKRFHKGLPSEEVLFNGLLKDKPDYSLGKRKGKPGLTHYRAKLAKEDIPVIFQLRKEGLYLKDIAAKFCVGKHVIWSVLAGHTYKDEVQQYRPV